MTEFGMNMLGQSSTEAVVEPLVKIISKDDDVGLHETEVALTEPATSSPTSVHLAFSEHPSSSVPLIIEETIAAVSGKDITSIRNLQN